MLLVHFRIQIYLAHKSISNLLAYKVIINAAYLLYKWCQILCVAIVTCQYLLAVSQRATEDGSSIKKIFRKISYQK
jgi:hypothetical protein